MKIEISELSTGYGDTIVSRNLCGTLHSAQLVCLLGSNGAGKSTLLRTLATFQPPIAGEIIIGGKPLSAFTPQQLARTIGVVLTERVDIQNMTADELVAMGRQPYTGFWGGLQKEDKEAVDNAIEHVGIASLRDRHIHTLSDGERQKVMVAKALAQGTPIILLDEPTAFLDFVSKVGLMHLLGRLAHEQGKIIFMSTHDVELAMQTADVLWLLDDTGLRQGTPAQLAHDGSIERFFASPGVTFDSATMRFCYNEG